ncbi:hypothetical protein BD770DRAFT_434252 [Pilaira anomala]|nr:hypothetical protein BD770DRAFT_434252 [Pilaira anomala]
MPAKCLIYKLKTRHIVSPPKNRDRSIGGVELQQRKKMGYRCDMIFCEDRDMLDHLLLIKNDGSNIQTIGFIHSGLESFFMTADRPVKYTTRINKSREIHISNDISGFGSTVLPALYSAWIAKEIIENVKNSLHKTVERNNIKDSGWLDDYWDEDRSKTIIPETSNSSDVRGKKKCQKLN